MTLASFREALESACAFYGHLFQPLTEAQTRILFAGGFTVDQAYGVACDVANGWTFEEALAALNEVAA